MPLGNGNANLEGGDHRYEPRAERSLFDAANEAKAVDAPAPITVPARHLRRSSGGTGACARLAAPAAATPAPLPRRMRNRHLHLSAAADSGSSGRTGADSRSSSLLPLRSGGDAKPPPGSAAK